eukprot:3233701-Prymnesium_polylepis.1
MRRQRSAGRDTALADTGHCHGHAGETHMGSSLVLPHHNTPVTPPGRFGRPRRNGVGLAHRL